jgi:hypothetical protein
MRRLYQPGTFEMEEVSLKLILTMVEGKEKAETGLWGGDTTSCLGSLGPLGPAARFRLALSFCRSLHMKGELEIFVYLDPK